MISATVKVFDYFPQAARAVDELAMEALEIAAVEAARTAASVGASRNATEIEVIPPHGDIEGFSSGIRGKWYYRFQSYGTLGRALSPKRPGNIRSHAVGTGIEPNRMFQAARSAGRRALLGRIRRGF